MWRWAGMLVLLALAGAGGGGATAVKGDEARWIIVADLGSTGSRAFVYHVQGDRVVGSKGRKVTPGISTLVSSVDPEGLVHYFQPLFDHAAQLVPSSAHADTPLYLKATAGMRLLPSAAQAKVYKSLFEALNQSSAAAPPCPFAMASNEQLGTISGADEGFFAALAVNYLQGRMDAHGRLVAATDTAQITVGALDTPTGCTVPLGALDMGGSSNQVVFHTARAGGAGCAPAGSPLRREDFFVHSYLGFGVDRVRERLLAHLAAEAATTTTTTTTTTDDPLDNPCAFPGLVLGSAGRSFVGTGDAVACRAALRRTLFPACPHVGSGACSVDGVVQPPISGHFVAMSVYFFALDAVRVLASASLGRPALPHWPTPTLREVATATAQFCGLPWADVAADTFGQHPNTFEEQKPHRCFEACYILTLLADGFGMDPDARDVTYALEVRGMEVEWTLGYALATLAGG